jgi:hypothetical protein
MRYVQVRITSAELVNLQKGVTAAGGINSLLRRLQAGLRIGKDGVGVLTIAEPDLVRIPAYWKRTGGRPGSGGYQSRIPIASLRPYLRSAAPLFDDGHVEAKAISWVYFKREDTIGDPERIKIGRGGDKRSSSGRTTDNPRRLITLVRFQEQPGRDERYFHQRFSRWRINPRHEWFWAAEPLMTFIEDERRAQSA